MSDPIRVIGYARVSTEEQAGSGQSLESQTIKIELFAKLHEHELVRIIQDPGVSAKSLDRPGLAEALALIRSGEVKGLVVAKLDRLTRSVGDLATLFESFNPKGPGELFSIADSVDTSVAAGRMVANVIVAIAQWERETIVERTVDAIDLKRKKGERLGQIPFGFKLGPDNKSLVINPQEIAVRGIIRELHASGLSLRGIAAQLDEMAVPTKRGAETWQFKKPGRSRATQAGWAFSTVRKILEAA